MCSGQNSGHHRCPRKLWLCHLWQRGFADVIISGPRDAEVIQVGQSNHVGPSKWTGCGLWRRCSMKKGHSDAALWSLKMRKGPRATECGHFQELEEGRKQSLSWSLQKRLTLACWDISPHDCKIINLCYFKALSLWWFVIRATGD